TKYPANQASHTRREISHLLHEEPGQRMFNAQERQVVVVLRTLSVGRKADLSAIKSCLVLRRGLARHPAFVGLQAVLHEAKQARHALEGAMRDGRPCRVFLSCKTHAATDVLLENMLDVREKLHQLRSADPKQFDKHFDARLLDVALYRIAPNDPPPGR